MKQVIKIVSFSRDGQDGGGTFWLYNSLKELQEDLKISDEKLQEILDEDDPYENGEINQNGSIEIEEVNGKLQLAKGVHLHWGQ